MMMALMGLHINFPRTLVPRAAAIHTHTHTRIHTLQDVFGSEALLALILFFVATK